MKNDFSRRTSPGEKHHQGVLMQQGRVSLDADWNEPQTTGGGGVSARDAGFRISLNGGGHLSIEAGRIYLDGILCQNITEVAFTDQPYMKFQRDPVSDGWSEGAPTDYIVYLHVWQRLVTELEDQTLEEVAFGGPDSGVRVRSAWRVGVLNVSATPRLAAAQPAAPACGDQLPSWADMVAPGTGTMTIRARPIGENTDASSVTGNPGYRGLENELYRVEVHDPGEPGQATFKWSRTNGSEVMLVRAISGSTVTVDNTDPDETRRLGVGQWVELSDDYTDAVRLPGQMAQITRIDPDAGAITLSAATNSPFRVSNRPKLRRWDVAASAGLPLLPVEMSVENDRWIPLEGGVEVAFGDGTYATGDYWEIPVRRVVGGVELALDGLAEPALTSRPARDIRHHYGRLAMLHADSSSGEWSLIDCRDVLPR